MRVRRRCRGLPPGCRPCVGERVACNRRHVPGSERDSVPDSVPEPKIERHLSDRVPWLRAAVLGANDGIVSTASLMLGVHASDAASSAVVTAGLAGLVAGALSMSVGEYVSVSSQRDSELADLEKERMELEHYPEAELRELTEIWVQRGLDRELASEVAVQLTAHDPLKAHLRDELNLELDSLARPTQAAVVSAVSFALGAAVPLLVGWLAASGTRSWALPVAALLALAITGALGARVGGGLSWRASLRVLLGGGVAMAATALIGSLIGTAV